MLLMLLLFFRSSLKNLPQFSSYLFIQATLKRLLSWKNLNYSSFYLYLIWNLLNNTNTVRISLSDHSWEECYGFWFHASHVMLFGFLKRCWWGCGQINNIKCISLEEMIEDSPRYEDCHLVLQKSRFPLTQSKPCIQ